MSPVLLRLRAAIFSCLPANFLKAHLKMKLNLIQQKRETHNGMKSSAIEGKREM